jgi:predicted patatin/cPLA2 family phospholipase
LADGLRYIDGGIGDPLPVLHALSLTAIDDVVVAIPQSH